jgi:hypothetical protein
MRRRRWAGLAVLTVAALAAAACSSTAAGPTVTVTQTSYQSVSAPGSGSGAAPSGGSSAGSTGSATGASTTSARPASGSATAGSSTSSSPSTTTSASNPNAEPDGFVPTKLKPGQKPPQFIAVSFDGAGWHEKWQYWFGIAKQVPFHFTANLTGLYLIDEAHKDAYHGAGHARGTSSLGSWNTPGEVKQEILDLNKAYADGDEIATHFMGHFCSDNPPGADVWTTADWNSDLDQFFDFWKNYKTLNDDPNLPTLNVPASEVTGERTPCLEGTQEALYPALVAHHMDYDQSFTRRGIVWPDRSPKYKIWNMGMAEFPMHGSIPGYGPNHFQITMDYNFWYSQEFDPSTGQMRNVSAAQSKADSEQVQATYQDMLDGSLAGSHAPLLLGNHFNDWNNNAYTVALGNFLLANCGKPDVHCVPFRDVVDWMKMQDPKVLAQLQAEPPVLGPPGSDNH